MSLDEDAQKEFRKRFRDNPVYKYVVDTGANISYSVAVMSTIEYCALGMEPEQVVKSRAAAQLMNMVISRPYGMYRDYVFKRFGVSEESSGVKKYLADLFVFNTMGIPMYMGILAFSGADAQQIAMGACTVPVISTFMSRTLGWWIDRVRKWCGVRTAYDVTGITEE